MADEPTSDERPDRAGGGLLGAMGGDLLKTSAGLVISGGAIAAVVVFLGRLWTDAYYRYFGLPTADLSLTVDEYAFQSRRMLILLALALATATAIVLATQPWKWSWHAKGDAASDDREFEWNRRRGALLMLCGAALVWLLVLHFVIAEDEELILDTWTLLPVLTGTAFGVLAGSALAMALYRKSPHERALLPVSVLLAGAIIYLPFAVQEFARFEALRDVQTLSLPHAVIEFVDEAPPAISRSDTATQSAHVYVVLSTPERLAVLTPFGCASVDDPEFVREGTRANGGRLARIADPCDVVTFNRSAVKSIRLFGDEQRAFNDRPETPELVSLGLTPIRSTYREIFDLGPSRPSPECADAAGIEDVDSLRGVWLRVRAPDGGRLAFDPTAVSATQRRPAFVFAASTADPGDCHLIYERAREGDREGRGVVLADGAEVLIFVAGTQEGDTVLREAALALTPVPTDETGDCTVAFGTLECPPNGS